MRKYKIYLYLLVEAGFLALVIIGAVAFVNLWDFSQIMWEKTPDFDLKYITATDLELSVKAFDRNNRIVEKVNFTTTDGVVKAKGNTAIWSLPRRSGVYKVKASIPGGKTIEREINHIDVRPDPKSLKVNLFKPSEEDKDDNDKDGLSNGREKELKTNLNSGDSDGDGLNDWVEVEKTKTDPLRADSDGDGIFDGDEYALGLNPLATDSKGDGKKDGERELSYVEKKEKEGVELKIDGRGNIARATIDKIENSALLNRKNLLPESYILHTDGEIKQAEIKMKYNEKERKQRNIPENEMTLIRLNTENNKFEVVESQVDSKEKLILAKVNKLGYFMMGSKKVAEESQDINVQFLIDNSGSMYSDEQLKQSGERRGNDEEFKRLDVTKQMIEKASENYKFSVAEFSGTYEKLTDFIKDKEVAKKAVDSMRGNWNSLTLGTAIASSLDSSMDSFNSQPSETSFIVLLTDGEDTSKKLGKEKAGLIKKAKEKRISICTIGLGDTVDEAILMEIGVETGCGYYQSGSADFLDKIYELMGEKINNNIRTSASLERAEGAEGKKKEAEIVIADSGFLPWRDGFSFDNYGTNKENGGQCYGMAGFANMYYRKKLPLKLEEKTARVYGILHPMHAFGYDLTGTDLGRMEIPLYNFRFTTPGMKNIFIPGAEMRNMYSNEVKDGYLMIKDNYMKAMDKIGGVSYEDVEIPDRLKAKYGGALKIKRPVIGVNKEDMKGATRRERGLVMAIARIFIEQKDDEDIWFGNAPDRAFNELKAKLKAKNPVVFTSNFHAVNAIKMTQSVNNPDEFMVYIYDNNYPNEIRRIKLERKKQFKWQLDATAWTNEYEFSATYLEEKDDEGWVNFKPRIAEIEF